MNPLHFFIFNVKDISEVRQMKDQPASVRRSRALVNILGTTQLHLRNPVVIAFWSAIFPGMGHMLLSKNIRGFILFTWEVTINLLSHINLAIFYTFTFRVEMAKQVLDTHWLLLYIPMYLFAIWDSHRTAVDMNNQFILAAREDAEIKPFLLHPLGVNYLDKGSPWAAIAWSMLSPGVGQLIIHRIIVAFFLIGWWVVVVINSNVLPAIHLTMQGAFEQSKQVVNPQWLLNIPSLYCFGIYDAYVNTVESNKLFEWEQSKFLRRQYQSKSFPMPTKYGGSR
jgi:TM2 domain-containing membrane protein YozV